MRKRYFNVNFDLLLELPEDWDMEDCLDYIKNMIIEDGLSEYINSDNVSEVL